MDGFTDIQTLRLSKEEIILIKEILIKYRGMYKPVYCSGLAPILTTDLDISEFLRELYIDEKDYNSSVSRLKEILLTYNNMKKFRHFNTKLLEKEVLWVLGQTLDK